MKYILLTSGLDRKTNMFSKPKIHRVKLLFMVKQLFQTRTHKMYFERENIKNLTNYKKVYNKSSFFY